MNYGTIKKVDIADGPGVRVSLFVSGCSHHCKGCFQPETWDFDYGRPFTEETEEELLQALSPAYIAGLTLLGGEPMEPENRQRLFPFLQRVRERYPAKTIWCYSGYTFEELAEQNISEILALLDVLVDGEFKEEEKSLLLTFRGSANQRLIDVKASLAAGHAVPWTAAEKKPAAK